MFGVIRTVALGTAAPTDSSCTCALEILNSPFSICISRVLSLPRSFCKGFTLSSLLGTQVYSGIWSNAEIAVGIVAACLPTFAVFFQRIKPTSSTGSSGQRFLGSTWSKLFSFGDKSSPTTVDLSLSDSPQKHDYQALAEGGNTIMFREAASVRSFVKLREPDLERGRMGQGKEATPPAKIIVTHELHQSSGQT